MADYLKIPEVARRLDVSEPTVRRMVKSGKLPSVFIGGAYRISEEDLAEYIENARVTPGKVPASSQPDFNGLLEEQRGAALESAVENARGLRESGQTRMTELLSLWRASRERQEEKDARLEYRKEMTDLLYQAVKAKTDLFNLFTTFNWWSPEARRAYKEAKEAGAGEVPNADWEEFQEADRFYYRLLGMVEGQQGLVVRQDSEIVEDEEAA